ncbi:hypothetical protein ACIGHB_22745 [Streptomyces sp. NPDC085460]|uniref:hypothetical protein n=1 Tax=Streptomyces sp. NPDC085460 TaxID=3365723 RepID=UPI0037CE0AC1
MMPATFKIAQFGEISIADLNNTERTIALYASDMPASYRYRKGDGAKLCAWIFQGAARLGLEELYLAAAYTGGYLGLWVEEQNTPGHDAAHFGRFPERKRFDQAQTLAALVTFTYRTSAEAIERSRHPLFETASVGVAVAA